MKHFQAPEEVSIHLLQETSRLLIFAFVDQSDSLRIFLTLKHLTWRTSTTVLVYHTFMMYRTVIMHTTVRTVFQITCFKTVEENISKEYLVSRDQNILLVGV